jgi:hypothetical protein
MKLSVFTKYQRESTQPFMCINPEHEMTLVPFMTTDLVIQLECFFPECGYKIIPGIAMYNKILNSDIND